MLPSAETIQIVLPAACIVLLVCSLRNPVYGVIAYFIILNAKLGDMYPELGAIRFELIVAVFVLVRIFLSARTLGNFLPHKNPINKAFWIFFLVGMISVVYSIDPVISWYSGGYFLLKIALFYIMIVTTIRTSSDLSKILWAFVLVAGWVAYEPVANYLAGNVQKELYGGVAYGRFGAAAGHVALANNLNQTIPMTLYFAMASKKRYLKVIAGSILVLLVFGIYASKSRGGLVGLVLMSLGIMYLAKDRVKAAIIVGFMFLFLVAFAATDYVTHMSTIKQGVFASKSSTDRFIGLLNGISMLEKHPIIGVGIGCYPEARKRYFHYHFFSHNLYGELLGELGFASIAWFYWMYLVIKRSRLLKRNLDPAFSGNMVFINILNAIQLSLIVRLVLGNLTHGALFWFWYMMAALTVGVQNVLIRENRIEKTRL